MQYFGHNFYTKSVIVAFMDFLSRIEIEKYGSATVSGTDVYVTRKIIPVPLQWAAREKWVEIIRSSSARRAMDPAIRDRNPVEMQWILPRMACNLTGLGYDSSRRYTKTTPIYSNTSSPNVYTPTPWNLDLELVVATRHIDDQFQIMEQILPYFGPTMSFDIKITPVEDAQSVPITLNSIIPDIPVDLPETDERLFTFTYHFTAKTNYYLNKQNPSVSGGIIDVQANLYNNGLAYEKIDVQWYEQLQKIETTFSSYIGTSSIFNPPASGL